MVILFYTAHNAESHHVKETKLIYTSD